MHADFLIQCVPIQLEFNSQQLWMTAMETNAVNRRARSSKYSSKKTAVDSEESSSITSIRPKDSSLVHDKPQHISTAPPLLPNTPMSLSPPSTSMAIVCSLPHPHHGEIQWSLDYWTVYMRLGFQFKMDSEHKSMHLYYYKIPNIQFFQDFFK